MSLAKELNVMHALAKGAEAGFVRETRRRNLCRIPPPKSERLGRTWIPAAPLLTPKGKCRKSKFVPSIPYYRTNPHFDRLSQYVFGVMLWKYGNYINDGLSKEEPKRAAVDSSKIITSETRQIPSIAFTAVARNEDRARDPVICNISLDLFISANTVQERNHTVPWI
jgi:hypothetical protein